MASQTQVELLSPVASSVRLPELRGLDTDGGHTEASATPTSTEQLLIVEEEDIPPNGGYGWVVAACTFLVNAHTWGVNSAWAIFLAHYIANSTFPDASNFEYALVGGLSISQALIISPLINLSIRAIGTRLTMCIGAIVTFVALFTSSYATSVTHIILSQGVCFGWGMGFLYIPASTVLPQWFSTKRSLAVGLATSGAGIGGLAYNLATNAAVQNLGVAWSYRLLAFCALAANLLSALLIRDRNKAVKPTQDTFNWRELGKPEVILTILWGGFAEIGYVTLLYSLPSYALSIGLTANQGSISSALLNLGLGVGRPVIGLLSDRFGRINVASIVTTTCAILCLAIWLPASSYGSLLLFSLTSGVCCGIFWSTASPVIAEVVGLRRLPSAFTVICMALVLPTTFGEPMALALENAAGYTVTKIFVIGMFVLASVSCVLLRGWKICDVEGKKDREGQRELTGRRNHFSKAKQPTEILKGSMKVRLV